MDLIVLLAAAVVALIVFGLLLRVVKATISAALTIALIVLVLQLVFGIGPVQLLQPLSQWAQQFWQLVPGGR
jgi:predicted neutral ceramidase superfamily lipid hydrolase